MDSEEIYQAIFIFNAIKDGWAVCMNGKGELEFTKGRAGLTEADKANYSKKFIDTYGVAGAAKVPPRLK